MNACHIDTYGIALATFWPSLAAVAITFLTLIYLESRDKRALEIAETKDD